MASIISAGTTSGTSLNLSGDTSGVLQLATNGSTTAVTITTAQNVGIGTASPSCRLDLNRGSAGLLANFTDGVNTNFQIGTTSLLATIGPSAGSTAMAFKTGDTERMRITSGGQVGIGTTSPSQKFVVYDATGGDNIIMATQGNAASMFMQASSTGDVGTFNNYPVRFLQNNTERMRINAGAAILCLSGGNTSATGTGIAFPATQSASSDANTLDDYEEGTWTPVPTSTIGSITSYTSAGTYVKIGRTVTITGQFKFTNVGTASGVMSVTNFPFIALTTTGRAAEGVVREDDLTGAYYFIDMNSNTTTADMRTLTGNSNPPWTTNYRYNFSFTYISST